MTHPDVMAALHRCRYESDQAEASLAALQRYKEKRFSVASASNDARNLHKSVGDAPAGGKGAMKRGSSNDKNSGRGNAKGEGGVSSGEKDYSVGNRWEDWSEADRAAFLDHLGDKVLALLLSSRSDFGDRRSGHVSMLRQSSPS